MSAQSDIEMLYVLAEEKYTEKYKVTSEKTLSIFQKNHIWENMILQHDYLHQISLQEVFEFIDKTIKDENKQLFIYHGTTYNFNKIDLTKSHDRRDFGKGFYTTILEQQAQQWAYRLSLRNHQEKYYVYKYCFIDNNNLKIKHFDLLNEEWLEFIKNNRFKGGLQHDYDVVIGPVADDNTMMTVQLYVVGVINATEAVQRLKFTKVNNQISFHTEKSLSYLQFIGKDEYNGTDLHI